MLSAPHHRSKSQALFLVLFVLGTSITFVSCEDLVGSDDSNGTGTENDTDGEDAVAVDSVSLEPSTGIQLRVGETGELNAVVEPPDATNTSVNWTSENSNIATIDAFGRVTGVLEGQTSVSVITEEGGHTDSLVVAVLPPPTEVGGIIDADAVWSAEQSPYTIGDPVQIAENVVLTIDAGVEVLRNSSSENLIEIWGEMVAVGTDDMPIKFNGTNFEVEEDGSLRLEHVEAHEGDIAVSGYGSQSLIIRDSYLEDFDTVSTFIIASAEIARTIFNGIDSVSITGANNTSFINNYFFNHGEPLIAYTSVRDTLSITGNTFADAGKVVFEVRENFSGGDIDASGNYWGTVDVEIIDSMILDRTDNLNRSGTINYQPILTDSDGSTPIP